MILKKFNGACGPMMMSLFNPHVSFQMTESGSFVGLFDFKAKLHSRIAFLFSSARPCMSSNDPKRDFFVGITDLPRGVYVCFGGLEAAGLPTFGWRIVLKSLHA